MDIGTTISHFINQQLKEVSQMNIGNTIRRLRRSRGGKVLPTLACVLVLTLSLLALPVQAAPPGNGIWHDVKEAQIEAEAQLLGLTAPRVIVPLKYRTVAADLAALDALLAKAPMEGTAAARAAKVVLSLPLPDGTFGRFQIVESPIMEPELAAKFPEIKTYLGQGLDDPTAVARMDRTPKGFHAMILSSAGTIYIDPYRPGDTKNYISYFKRDFVTKEVFQEFPDVKEALEGVKEGLGLGTDRSPSGAALLAPSGAVLRTYRAAVVGQTEYTTFHGGTVNGAMAAIITTMNRVNGIYENEVAIRMVLVANNNTIVFTGADGLNNACINADLPLIQGVIDGAIGAVN